MRQNVLAHLPLYHEQPTEKTISGVVRSVIPRNSLSFVRHRYELHANGRVIPIYDANTDLDNFVGQTVKVVGRETNNELWPGTIEIV